MTSIKQVCLGVAVAGVVAGAGSAVGTAVASAEPSAPDSTSSAEAAGDSPNRTGSPARTRARGSVGAPKATAAEAGADSALTTQAGDETSAPKNKDRPRASVRARAADAPRVVLPSAAAPRQRDVVLPGESAPAAAVTEAPSAGEAVSAAAAQPVVAVIAPRSLRATRALDVAIAAAPAPAPIPVLPLLPTPILPVSPASSVAVGASATTMRRNAASVSAAQIADAGPNHVLLIGIDGINLSKILEYAYDSPDNPNSGFRTVMDQGITGATSLVGHTTISGPSWSTILTGALDNKTGVINNIFNPAPYTAWPTVFNLIEYNQPGVDTSIFANWQYMNDIAKAGGYPVDENVFVDFVDSWEATDRLVVDKTIERILATQVADSTFVFSYQVGVDEAGHEHGGDSPQYRAAVISASQNLRLIMEAIDVWEGLNPGEEWTVIVTTDHGHQPQLGFGHGFQSPAETSSFVIFDLEGDGGNDNKQNLAYNTADITPTIISLFGIPQRSDFDGTPMQEKATSIVDPGANLKQALNDAIAMYGYPDIGTNIALGVRTVFASIPYFLDGFVTDITAQLQGIVEQDIFLISALAGLTELAVQFTGDILVGLTQAIARVVGYLTGAGTIPPSDDPLPAPPVLFLPGATLV